MAVLRRSCALNPRQPRSGVPACPWGTGRGRSGHRGAWINIGRHMSLCSSPPSHSFFIPLIEKNTMQVLKLQSSESTYDYFSVIIAKNIVHLAFISSAH